MVLTERSEKDDVPVTDRVRIARETYGADETGDNLA